MASMPLHIVVKKVYRKLYGSIGSVLCKYRDVLFCTYIKKNVPIIRTSYIPIACLDVTKIDRNVAEYLSQMYLEHRFDLLGTGWIRNSYDSESIGLEGYKYSMNVEFDLTKNLLPSHYQKSEAIYGFVDDDYVPIDWQKDYKSGYRWNQRNWYKHQRDGIAKGADIKIPWELSRLQHLPQLAIFSLILPEHRDKFIREFRNQILDFIANNPPRMGVNWACTMDVGIRVANMLIAYDLFTQIDKGNILDEQFKQIFSNSIYEHGLHIIRNLEYDELLTSNHYLADIAGLLFASAYLESDSETMCWLDFAIYEMINEIEKQFNDDGSNFEASTSYHRLSGELAIYSLALILGLTKDRRSKLKKSEKFSDSSNTFVFSNQFVSKLFKMGCFTAEITKPNNNIPQIGDNDSGRFFRFSPNGNFLSAKEAENKYYNLKGYVNFISSDEELFWDENILNHHTFVASCAGLFAYSVFEISAKMFPLEKSVIEALAKGRKLETFERVPKIPEMRNVIPSNETFEFCKTMKFEFKDYNLVKNINLITYPDFGLYIFKSDYLYLCIMAGGIGQNGNGGHAHNDKLSFELNVAGRDIVVDAGCYLYTALIDRRNEFRSVRAHNVPIVNGQEQCRWHPTNKGWFSMINETDCKLIFADKTHIEFYLQYREIRQKRIFQIAEHEVTITDFSNVQFSQNINERFSPGYGKLIVP